MNKKENIKITLNGVNVSSCKYLYNSKDGLLCTLYDYNVFYDTRCTDNPDCYYKQLQHTTTQHNKLVEQNESLQTEIISLQEKIECLKYVAEISNNGLKAVTDKAIKLTEDNNVLNKTLKEIEKICVQMNSYYVDSPITAEQLKKLYRHFVQIADENIPQDKKDLIADSILKDNCLKVLLDGFKELENKDMGYGK